MRFRAHHAICCALAVSISLVTLAGCTAQQPPTRAPYFSATSISLDSPTDGWAVGSWIVPRSTSLSSSELATITPAMAYLQRGRWRLATASVTGSIGDDRYQLVRMLSPTDGWATTLNMIYHFDGVHWSLAIKTRRIADFQWLSPTEGWAVGPLGILRFSHGAWQDVTATLPPPPADWRAGWDYPGLHSVAIVSSTDAWATGDGGMIWHFDGAQWSIAASPYFPNRYYASPSLDGITPLPNIRTFDTMLSHPYGALFATQMLSAAQGFSVGGANPAASFGSSYWGPAVVEQYEAGAWKVIYIIRRNSQPPSQFRWPVFYSLAMTSAQDGWIGGAWMRPTGGGSGMPGPGGLPDYTPLLLRYQAGQWTYAEAPDVGAIRGLAMVSPDEGWAAADGGLLHYSGGQWWVVAIGA